jgi:hypothetical protein
MFGFLCMAKLNYEVLFLTQNQKLPADGTLTVFIMAACQATCPIRNACRHSGNGWSHLPLSLHILISFASGHEAVRRVRGVSAHVAHAPLHYHVAHAPLEFQSDQKTMKRKLGFTKVLTYNIFFSNLFFVHNVDVTKFYTSTTPILNIIFFQGFI